MNEQELRDTLVKLQHDLDHLEPWDEASRERLVGMKNNIHAYLEGEHDHETLNTRLQESVVELEAEHPLFVQAVRDAIHILSNLGI